MYPNAGYAFAALFAVAVFAFWPSYFSQPSAASGYMHVHAAVMASWMLLLVVQPSLIRARRNDVHRRIGKTAFVLAPLAVVTALLLAHSRLVPLDAAELDAVAPFVYLPLQAACLFGLTAGLALLHRRSPALHARYMICTALTLIDPAMARILGFRFAPLDNDLHYALIGFAVTDAILLGLLLSDLRSRATRTVFGSMLVVFGIVHLGYFTLARTEAWHSFVAVFRALPPTT